MCYSDRFVNSEEIYLPVDHDDSVRAAVVADSVFVVVRNPPSQQWRPISDTVDDDGYGLVRVVQVVERHSSGADRRRRSVVVVLLLLLLLLSSSSSIGMAVTVFSGDGCGLNGRYGRVDDRHFRRRPPARNDTMYRCRLGYNRLQLTDAKIPLERENIIVAI